MHTEVLQWIAKAKGEYPESFTGCKVLEVGSRNVNGSPRRYFTDCLYIGIDIMDGKDVDTVCNINDYTVKGFDTVVCCEMLEHDAHWQDSLVAMYRALTPSGLLIITAAGPNRPEHGTKRTTPKDSPGTLSYYRNITSFDLTQFALHRLINCTIEYGRDQQDIYFTGIKI